MTAPFMRAYALLLVKTCHRRNAPGDGRHGGADPDQERPGGQRGGDGEGARRQGARGDRRLRRHVGRAPGRWCRSPRRCSTSTCRGPNQYAQAAPRRERDGAKDLLDFQPEAPITEAGLRNNVQVGIQYIGSWLAGNGCVPIFNLMEDAATAEISRSQVWQWMRSPKGVLDDGRKVTRGAVPGDPRRRAARRRPRSWAPRPTPPGKLRRRREALRGDHGLATTYVEFLTLPAYEAIDVAAHSGMRQVAPHLRHSTCIHATSSGATAWAAGRHRVEPAREHLEAAVGHRTSGSSSAGRSARRARGW